MKGSHEPPARNPRHPPDAHVDALERIADEMGRVADAILFHARATAGEFDQGEDEPRLGQSLSDVL